MTVATIWAKIVEAWTAFWTKHAATLTAFAAGAGATRAVDRIATFEESEKQTIQAADTRQENAARPDGDVSDKLRTVYNDRRSRRRGRQL